MYDIYTIDDPRMNEFEVKKAITIIDTERKKVLEYIYMLHKDTGKEYIKHSSMYSKSTMANIVKTATFEEYENGYVDIVVDAIVNSCNVHDGKENVVKLATALKGIDGKYGHSLAKDKDGKVLLSALIDNFM